MQSIDLGQVDWFYVILLALFVCLATFLGNLLSFNHRGAAAVLSALLFGTIFVFWTYYPHRVPLLPRTITMPNSAATTAPAAAPAAPAAPQRPSNPVRDITPPRTDVSPPATPAAPPAAPAR